MNGRILVFNCHEAWVYQLRLLKRPLDIVIGLSGRHISGWDENLRPVPETARLISLTDALNTRDAYDCIIAHNLTDLLDVKTLPGPRIFVVHLTVEGMLVEQRSNIDPGNFRRTVTQFLESTRTHAVAVSRLKGHSWGLEKNIVLLTAAPGDYPEWTGDLPQGLRISNYITRRANTLLWDFHERAFAGIPLTLVGHNPELPGVFPSQNWNDLKNILRRHRFFVHTAHPQLEDGYNMATLEAMAAGLPVLGNRHPTSPVIHGENGFLSDDPVELNAFARRLCADRELAATMGRAAQRTVTEYFPPDTFRSSMLRAISAAQEKWQTAAGRNAGRTYA